MRVKIIKDENIVAFETIETVELSYLILMISHIHFTTNIQTLLCYEFYPILTPAINKNNLFQNNTMFTIDEKDYFMQN